MNKRAFTFFTISMILLMHTFASEAHDHKSHDTKNETMASQLVISDAWARATFALAKTGAAYFVASNNSDADINLSAISVSEEVAMKSEIHHTVMRDDMMQMQELSDGVIIKAGESLEFAPGGKHLMLMGLVGPLNKGEFVTIEMQFKDGSSMSHRFPVVDKRNATH